ncbi:MAG: serine protease inhibitor [Arthrobacter sp.]|uniref:serine protease inhibitor n=1 Tax=unclassified Arthrobacter TaxID=235627 RepID=UPI00264C0E00|nr:serine protease inhibitor [Micrococcaceae bacterium]MDN5813061.1 serine protease inhibitor [Micrococcaceae bacterium]MDN5823905.1 serine protease inhibitor [Micrococcaceae bacterium]MDN5879988.1 serine protease inhibitor [Micrococcaceae bacterium]MDN5886476.1 serine protease inhibitor [Micrococcaceae bacterium]
METNQANRWTARTLSTMAAAALGLLLLSGCAGESPDSEPTQTTAATESSAPEPTEQPAGPEEGTDADLSITITSNGEDVVHRYRLVCSGGVPGKGTDHPQAEEACTFLDGPGKTVLTGKAKKDADCTQESAGPQTAIVEGTLNETTVQRAFALGNGCKISAWKSAEALLGRGTASGDQ